MSTYKKYLDKIYGDETKLGRIDIGDRADEYWGTKFMRSPDGEIIHGANNGLPIVDPVPRFIGHYNPDFSFGWNNSVRYKNWNFVINLDGVVGGKIFSSLNQVLWDSGRHPASVNKWREDYVNGINSYVGNGVIVTSGELKTDAIGNVIEDTRAYSTNTIPTNYKEYVSWQYRTSNADESNLVDKSYVKLRVVMITYNLPNKVLSNTFMKKVSFTLTAKNLLYLAKYKDADLDAFVNKKSFTLQTPSFRKFGCNINVEF